MSKMKIFIDYDTTLVNLIDPWVSWVNKKYNVTIASSDINRWYYLGEVFGKEADDFWKSEAYNHYEEKDFLQPYEGAVDFFHTLQKMYGTKNIFIVSSTRDHHRVEKMKHAIHHFGIEAEQFLPVNKEKYKTTTGGVLIDDYPLHVMEHIASNREKGIVFNYQDRFGWCRECNYVLDKTLDAFVHVAKDKKFSIATSYSDILKELDDD